MLPIQVWTARPDGALDYVNQRVLDYFDRTFDEMLGAGWQDVVHPDDLAGCVSRWTRALQTGEPYDVEFRLRRSDGAFRWHQGLARAVHDASGRIVQWLGTNTDFEDASQTRRRLEQGADALRLSERRLLLALEAGRLGTWEWDITAGKIHWSGALERMHGIPPGTFAGTLAAYQADIHPDDRERVLAEIAANVEKAEEHNLLYRIVRPDRAVRWLEAHGRFEVDERGKPQRLIGVCGDVTDRISSETTRTGLAAEQAARHEAEQAGARTQQILAGIADAFLVCGEDWRIVFANEAGASLFGRRAEEVLGRNVWELAPETVGPQLQAKLEGAMTERSLTTVEERIEARDEWREWSAYPLHDGGLAFYARDITGRKREEALRARMASYAALRAEVAGCLAKEREMAAMLQKSCEALISHLPLSFARVWLLDPSGQWLDLQASAGLYTHLDGAHRRVRMGELKIGKIAAERRPHLTNAVAQDDRISDPRWALREGMVAFVGFPLIAGDALVGVLAGFARVTLPEDMVTAVGTVSDAIAHGVARRRAEIELDERAQELARSNADLEQFAYVASHDLQEPLRIVASYTQLLARRYKGRLDQDADEFIAFAVDGVTRMQRLIRDLLAYSRVGTRGREAGPVNLEKVLANALDNLRQALSESEARVTHDPLPQVLGNESQLVQLFQNLLGNALKFRGSGPPRVHVTVREQGAQWELAFQDNGVGIEAQYFDRIFVIFQRLHSIEKYPGTGIGLALCKKIVEKHGGRIWVESDPGHGSTFFLTLPMAPGAPLDEEPSPAPSPPPAASP